MGVVKKYQRKDWGRIVKAVRVLRDESLRQTARKIGISASTLSRIENGKEPDVNSLYAVAQWLGITMDKFFRKP